jgi:prenyltransferase beta subunit
MLIETGSRIDMVQLEINTLEIFFWTRRISSNFFKKARENFLKIKNPTKYKIDGKYFKQFKCFISNIFVKFNFFHPLMYANKPWILYWLLNSIDISYFHSKKKFFLKNINRSVLFLFEMNLSQIFKNSISSLFTLYSTVLYSTIIFKKNSQFIDYISIKSIYHFIKSLTIDSLSPRNSNISDCDGRNLLCIFTISSLLGILTLDLENIFIEKVGHLAITLEGFSSKRVNGAHGALTYCWVSSFFFLSEKYKIKLHLDIKKWFGTRQHFLIFGFSGRISKIPDSCYNFWIGASLILLNVKFSKKLQNTFIFCSDKMSSSFSDRSGKIADSYHLCYSTCGFAMLNFLISIKINLKSKKIQKMLDLNYFYNLAKLSPLFGLREGRVISFISGINLNRLKNK